MPLPQTVFLSEIDIVGAGVGITRYSLRKAVRNGALKKVVFPGRKYGKFRRRDVVTLFQIK